MKYFICLIITLPCLASLEEIENIFPILAETQSITEATQTGVSSSALTLSYDSIVNVYFISEGAGYHNTFGWYDAAKDPTLSENRNLIWPDASGTGSGLAGGGSLNSGDVFSLGEISAGTTLGFYLQANGANNPSGPIYFTDTSFNPDGIDHVLAGLMPDIGLVAIGFEDLWGGGDEDYNDLIIAIDIGIANTQAIAAAAPEPSFYLLLVIGLSFYFFQKRSDENAITV